MTELPVAGRRRPVRGAPRSPLRAAGVAVAGCVLLLGSSGSLASWSDTVQGENARISSGNLAAEVVQTGPVVFPTADAAPGVLLVGASAHGIVPGVQGLEWTYQITNSASSSLPARPALRILTTAVGERYTALRPYLQATVTAGAGTPVAVPASAFTAEGIDHTVTLPAPLAPGESTTAVLRIWVPGVHDGVPLVYQLRPARSSTLTGPTAAMTMGNTVVLSQEPGLR